MPIIRFKAQLVTINSWTILRIPEEVSAKLSSRGMIMVKGNINGSPFQVPLEPDGKGSHWCRIEESLLKVIGATLKDIIDIQIEPIKEWPEPEIPDDLQTALVASPEAQSVWIDITPMARWDWIRWIRSTKQPETRQRRVDVTISKLRAGKRRPCCFNRSICTVTSVSHNGVLLDPI